MMATTIVRIGTQVEIMPTAMPEMITVGGPGLGLLGDQLGRLVLVARVVLGGEGDDQTRDETGHDRAPDPEAS